MLLFYKTWCQKPYQCCSCSLTGKPSFQINTLSLHLQYPSSGSSHSCKEMCPAPRPVSCSLQRILSPLCCLAVSFFTRLLTSEWALSWELSRGLHICSSGLRSLAPELPQLSTAHRESSPLPQMGSPRGWLTLTKAREGQTF